MKRARILQLAVLPALSVFLAQQWFVEMATNLTPSGPFTIAGSTNNSPQGFARIRILNPTMPLQTVPVGGVNITTNAPTLSLSNGIPVIDGVHVSSNTWAAINALTGTNLIVINGVIDTP